MEHILLVVYALLGEVTVAQSQPRSASFVRGQVETVKLRLPPE